MSFPVVFKLGGLCPNSFNYEKKKKKKWKAMIRLVNLIVHVDTDYYNVRTVTREGKERRKEKQREKKGDTSCQFVITKPVMW